MGQSTIRSTIYPLGGRRLRGSGYRDYLHSIALTLPDETSSDLPMAEAHGSHLEVGDSEGGSEVTGVHR